MEELINKIELILILEGQHDKRFKLGEYIKYTPYEVAEILKKHIDELKTHLCNDDYTCAEESNAVYYP